MVPGVNNFRIFTKPQDLYMPSLVRHFYKAYGQALQKSKSRVQMVLKPLDAIEVRVCKFHTVRMKLMISWVDILEPKKPKRFNVVQDF